MKFLVHVSPALALRSGNERIRAQHVDIDLADLSDEQRDVVSRSFVLDQQAVVDVTRFANGMRVPELTNFGIALADKAAVLQLVSVRLDVEREVKRLEDFASKHLAKAVRHLIDNHEPDSSYSSFGLTPEEDVTLSWLKQNYPKDVDLLQHGEPPPQRGPKKQLDWDNIFDPLHSVGWKVRTNIGDDDELGRIDPGDLRGSGLPNDEAGIRYLAQNFSRLFKDIADEAWVHDRFEKRRGILRKKLLAELESLRPEIDAIIQEARDHRDSLAAESALRERVIEEADRKNPALCILERWQADVLPDDEFLAILREAAFAPLIGLKRFKRIADSEVKRRRNQELDFETKPCKSVKAKHFQLAKDISSKIPGAAIEHVQHVASVDGEPMIEREAVRVTLNFAGYEVSREYVAE